jgi:hypothetical protein
MPDGIDAAVDAVEGPSANSRLDHPRGESGRPELPECDHAVLSRGDPRRDRVAGVLSTHTGV